MKHLKSLKRFINKFTIIGLIVLLVGGFFLFGRPKKQDPLTFASVQRQTIKSTISASGILTGKASANLKFKSGGKMSYLAVKVGDNVKAGQLIASLDTRDLSIALQQAENDYRSKQAAAQKVEDDVKDHSKDETFTQQQTRTAAQAARDSAFDEVKAARLAFQNATIFAPVDGLITQADFFPGQVVSASDIIVKVVDFSETIFEADVDESDIGNIKVGQKADITLNTYGEKVFQGEVGQIIPQTKTISSGATVVTVRITIKDSSIALIANLNGQANIITAQESSVLVIPQEALKNEDTALVKDGDSIRSVQIKVGIRSDTEVEVVSGLTENQTVVTNPSVFKGNQKTGL
ncbi:hypothetical protein A2631_03105 [Candidatus Daviesbacteria bacterium RIFCSPHIGHO2_01_FULL_44_29]|uniref:Uncharacterized protein n=1 Tax=Candidatus Daviesbacteria bacterium RIFCSPHIGHO2_02_FULL_43_12 TaxID=1797776 RepID=A0A1F5KKF0_9BACT|nr:MAG: hypothetical protein A2631_03105 [Candidatus Daviesbacteria bacterium RIFCSPHIGHO2_01_FULL_44_29]OGE40777.1 MAG: hypothetical protein A3E86_02240 [Candidatus Daviesbacteria bacterium RIFCSPHIGHO2_12_FULL_47_45]OGE41372.1 MAG: hypothetical protein A3D25_02500 [Candidatus Daviesbacteria bacterium RIFCSPHIGHO2_02_FULL_43_12]OGE69573.1 MAG: hypothetical protein A3B55_04245 [Candidatus Daviesbacteria bacterium RIFCSPLOWO2_01_FULL_43_15]